MFKYIFFLIIPFQLYSTTTFCTDSLFCKNGEMICGYITNINADSIQIETCDTDLNSFKIANLDSIKTDEKLIYNENGLLFSLDYLQNQFVGRQTVKQKKKIKKIITKHKAYTQLAHTRQDSFKLDYIYQCYKLNHAFGHGLGWSLATFMSAGILAGIASNATMSEGAAWIFIFGFSAATVASMVIGPIYGYLKSEPNMDYYNRRLKSFDVNSFVKKDFKWGIAYGNLGRTDRGYYAQNVELSYKYPRTENHLIDEYYCHISISKKDLYNQLHLYQGTVGIRNYFTGPIFRPYFGVGLGYIDGKYTKSPGHIRYFRTLYVAPAIGAKLNITKRIHGRIEYEHPVPNKTKDIKLPAFRFSVGVHF